MIFFLANWKAITFATVTILLLGFSYHLGAVSVQSKWDRVNLEATNKVLATERNQQVISNEVSHGYQNDLANIDAIFSGLLPAANGDLPKIPNTTSGLNATANCDGLSEVKRKAAQKQTSQLIWLQKWVTEQAK